MPDEPAYDAFVSYRHQEPDKAWVRQTLVPALDAAGLRVCVDHRDFRLGYPIVEEMGRAVEQSRCTVAVLTPAYLAGRFVMPEIPLDERLERVEYPDHCSEANPCRTRGVERAGTQMCTRAST